MAVQPSGINIPLFIHQLNSIEEMEQLEKTQEITISIDLSVETRLGIFADLPGYGKSLSMLGLIDKTKDAVMQSQYADEKIKSFPYVKLFKIDILKQLNTSLILVNVSILSQWIIELERTILKYAYISKPSEIESIEPENYDVLLVSNNIYNQFAPLYKKYCWKRFVIDEPASFKFGLEQTNACFYWLITGTPNELYQHRRRSGFLGELLPDELDLFNYLIVKNEDHVVRQSYNMPPTTNMHYKCSLNIASLFEGLLPEHIIEMIEGYNIDGIKDLLECENDFSILSFYREKKEKKLEELRKMADCSKYNERIQLLESHLKLFNQRLARYLLFQKCFLCNSLIKEPTLISCCQTIFCEGCVRDISTCPICYSFDYSRIPVSVNSPFNEEDSFMEKEVFGLHKMAQMMSIIGDATDKKILIFSHYNESFIIIKKWLDEKKLVYLELKGTKERRDNVIDMYKTGNVNILLLNTIHSGAGLNLQETTDILIFHRIHDYQKIQVIGRANRIGRKIPLSVHYLE